MKRAAKGEPVGMVLVWCSKVGALRWANGPGFKEKAHEGEIRCTQCGQTGHATA